SGRYPLRRKGTLGRVVVPSLYRPKYASILESDLRRELRDLDRRDGSICADKMSDFPTVAFFTGDEEMKNVSAVIHPVPYLVNNSTKRPAPIKRSGRAPGTPPQEGAGGSQAG